MKCARVRTALTYVALAAFVFLVVRLNVAAASVSSQSEQHFFPRRPVAAHMRTMTGILEEYGIGNASGSIRIKMKTATIDLYTAADVRLDGRIIACDHPPVSGQKRSMFCPSWPSNVLIGKTVVTARYWLQHFPGFASAVRVTDDLRSKNASHT